MIGDRIRARRRALGLSQTDIARACSVSKASVSDWEKGAFQPKNKELVAEALKTNKLWLEKGQGSAELSNVANVKYNEKKLPLISWVQAGAWCSMESNIQPDEASEYYFCPEKTSDSSFALKVVGESMFPDYIDGEVIYVDPEVEPVNGSHVVVCQNGDSEVTFKKLIIESDEKMLKATNPNWPNPIIKMLPDAKICGVVVGSYRKRN